MRPILFIDGYKADHRRQYPEGTTRVYSNWTPRSSRIADQGAVVTFGLQYFLERYMNQAMDRWFFERPIGEVCDQYAARMAGYLGPNDSSECRFRFRAWETGITYLGRRRFGGPL